MSLLLEHNIPVYENFCKCLEENHECILITATGTGKSYIVEEFLQQHNETALVVVPTKAIAKSWMDLSSNVNVVTYSWFMRHYKSLIDQFTYVVFDEAHHIGGDGPWGVSIRNFKKMSNSTYFIGLTADSVRYSDKNKDVAEIEFNGHIVYGYNTAEAVEMGILPNAKYVSALFDLPALRKQLLDRSNNPIHKQNSNKIEKLFGRLDIAIKNYKSIQQILRQHLSKVGNRKGIVFVDSIRNIPTGIRIMQSAFKDPVLYVHSNMSQKEIAETIDKFKSLTRGYIVAVDILNEGVHIDGVNTIIMLRKTMSPSVYKQQIGRALSSASPDELVYIFDFVGNATEIMDYYREYHVYMEDDKTFIDRKIMRDVSSRNPIISNQFIIDESTKEIISIVDQIQRLSNRYYTDNEFIAILSNCDSYKEAVEKTGLSYEYLVVRAKKLGLSELLSSATKHDPDRIIPILENAKSIKDIRNELNCSYSTAKYLVEKFGFRDKFLKPKEKRPDRFSKNELAIIEEMASAPKNTYSIDDVANRLGLSRDKVHRKLIKLCISDRFTNYRDYTDEEIAELIEICKTSKTKKEAISRINNRFPKMVYKKYNRYLQQYNSEAISIIEQKSRLDDMIRKYYSTCGLNKVCEMLPNLSKHTIYYRAKQLGVPSLYASILTDEHKKIIETYYSTYGSDLIEKFNLPITRDAVRSYANTHGIKRIPFRKDPKLINFIRNNMNDTALDIRKKIIDTFGISIGTGIIYSIKRELKKEETQ